MSDAGSDRRRLDELQSLYRQIREVEMPPSVQSELDQLGQLLITATERADKILDGIASAMSLLLDIYDYIKTLPAADDG
jgi:hypothetical protein